MIAPSYALTASERVLPRLALDFTTGALDPRVSVTRALNTATCIASSGFVTAVNADLPRFDYDPATLAPKGLLIEESRSNLILQSQFQGNWTANAGTTTFLGTYVTSPDGTANGRILNDTSASAAAYVYQGVSFTSGTAYTFSVYVKKGVSRYFALTSFTQSGRALFDLSNYSLSSVTGIVTSATITAVGGGWYRCTATMTANATGANNLGFGDFEAVPTGDLYYLWGAQVEAGTFATSYIPTTTTSLTRNADVVRMTGTNFSSWYNASEGAFLTKFSFPTIPTAQFRYILSANDGTATNFITIAGNTTSNVPAGRVIAGGVTQASMGGGAITANVPAIGVLAYKLDSFAYSQNGATTGTAASGTVPSVSRLDIGALTTSYANCHIQRIAYWPQRITNSETLAFSK